MAARNKGGEVLEEERRLIPNRWPGQLGKSATTGRDGPWEERLDSARSRLDSEAARLIMDCFMNYFGFLRMVGLRERWMIPVLRRRSSGRRTAVNWCRQPTFWHVLVALVPLIVCLAQAPPVEAGPPEDSLERGIRALQTGAFNDAVSHLSEARRGYEQATQPAGQIRALIYLAKSYSALGLSKRAIESLERARVLVLESGEPAKTAAVLAGLGNAYLALGAPGDAETYLRQSLEIARGRDDSGLAAIILNDLGNVLATRKQSTDALAAYRESTVLADKTGQRLLAARALANAATLLRVSGDALASKASLDDAVDRVRGVGPSHDLAFALVGIGLAYRELRPALPEAAESLSRAAYGAFTEATSVGQTIGDRRTISYAVGHLASLYEDERRFEDALQLTRRAIFSAQQANAPESLYRWEWQAARLLTQLGKTDDAIAAYRRAVGTLQSIRGELSGGPRQPGSFREAVGPVYLGLVDLLLQRTTAPPRREGVEPDLSEAREIVELLKVAELRDYFRDDCVDLALSKATKLDVVSRTAVVVYPILLPDRIELLVSLPSGLKRVSVPVGMGPLTQEIRGFRRMLEKRTTREFLPHAQRLYDWLIRPLESELSAHQIDTLIFVPDGPLRTIPMAALHDGEHFLVEQYALAVTPGLSLTDPRPVERPRMKVLAMGVTESVQGFPALPNVAAELQALHDLLGSTTLVNENFVVPRMEAELKNKLFTIVHVASHGHFGGDVGQTYLLAFDDKVTMDRLDQLVGMFKFREEPLDLLTLSACDTAAGDDRAALGLAGVAVKAGARSALATLWEVNDRVSADLVTAFYRGLKDPDVSRAAALRQAQRKILGDPRYDHPGFWSPFLLINNWL
jgi:CHAT domain-containing protein